MRNISKDYFTELGNSLDRVEKGGWDKDTIVSLGNWDNGIFDRKKKDKREKLLILFWKHFYKETKSVKPSPHKGT